MGSVERKILVIVLPNGEKIVFPGSSCDDVHRFGTDKPLPSFTVKKNGFLVGVFINCSYYETCADHDLAN